MKIKVKIGSHGFTVFFGSVSLTIGTNLAITIAVHV